MPQKIPLPQFNNNPLLRLNGRCPSCNTAYDFQRLKILAERDQSILAYLECNQCGTSVLSLLQISPNGLSTNVLMTDLTADEVENRLDAGRSIESDELIDFHTFIEGDSSFSHILTQ